MRWIRVAGLVALLTVVAAPGSAQRLKPITLATAAVFKSWFDAVKAHTPGRADDSVVTVAAFSYETREQLNDSMWLFLSALMRKPYDTKQNKAMESIAAMGHAAGLSFLKQAAVLHSDVAAYSERFPGKLAGVTKARPLPAQELKMSGGMHAPMKIERNDQVPPLLIQNRLLLNTDGEVLGEVVASWNWPFARSLLDLLNTRGVRERATDPFVSAWYHATTAYMFASGLYGDATPHLNHAAEILPDDAQMIFDRGCYAELLGLPMHQALLPENDAGVQGDTDLRVPSAAKTNAEAERLYRRALAIDSSLAEARVRLARLLVQRHRPQEAAGELKGAVMSQMQGVVAFYAHLFAGRAAQAVGDAADASLQYHAALALFPDAQSALLATSQLALLGADVRAALSPIERLGSRSSVFTSDPWWQYHLCTGREADDLLKALWASVPR